MTMKCAAIAPLVDELVDGTLDERRASAVRGHVRTCAACARLLERTAEIAEGLRALEPVGPPPPALWAAIEARLAGEEIADGKRPRWWWWWQAWRRPIGYGAAVAAAGALAVTIYVSRKHAPAEQSPAVADHQATPAQPPVTPAPAPAPVPAPSKYDHALARVEELDAEYAKAVADLKEVARAERGRWRPEVASAFDENLAAIDDAIERQRRIAREQPGDVRNLDALHASYRKQIDYLQEAVMRGEVSR